MEHNTQENKPIASMFWPGLENGDVFWFVNEKERGAMIVTDEDSFVTLEEGILCADERDQDVEELVPSSPIILVPKH